MGNVEIFGPDGTVVSRFDRSAPSNARGRRQDSASPVGPRGGQGSMNALAGGHGGYGGTSPYDAADIYGPHMGDWQPYLWSPDGEINMFRDRIVSRMRDVERNDGWASGAMTTLLDQAIGGNFRPIARPHWQVLARKSGNTAFDAVWAREYAAWANVCWTDWADGDGRWCDVSRNQLMSQVAYLAFRHYLIDGDALAMMHWLPDRVGYGAA
ncbi:MAG: hypothetical protein QOF22_2317, partial [Bradyrhizobium sp.]|nr:hypothetical protein [Bradyrhizobium sp.]